MAIPSLYPLLVGYVVVVTAIALAIMVEHVLTRWLEGILAAHLFTTELQGRALDYIPFPLGHYVNATVFRHSLEEKLQGLITALRQETGTRREQT